MSGFPDELVQQFRAVALERLGRLEVAWASVVQSFSESSATLLHRELHTLKGESKMLGFTDVNLVCHKLEDLVEVARGRGYAIDEDFDLAVNMAIRFMAMLVRKKVGAHLGGIDLPGFIKQIDGILAELRPEPKVRATTGAMQPLKPVAPGPRVPAPIRAKLSDPAIDAFVEYATAHGTRRDRLRASWHGLRDLIGIQRAVVGPGQLAKHKQGAQALARELGKQVDVVLDMSSSEATAEVLNAVDTALLHLVRNAVDHGIESPEGRAAAAKPAFGVVRVECAVEAEQLVATVSDDGSGVSLDTVRTRALELGLIAASDTNIAPSIDDRWLDLVCQPGFTTRASANDVSGRGVGLDAVRTSIREVGGTLSATTTSGTGTSWKIVIPVPRITFDAHMMRVPHLPFPIVLDATWKQIEAPATEVRLIDIAHRLGFVDEAAREDARYFARDGQFIGVITERTPQPAAARLLVASTGFVEVVLIEAVEGLLIHPERL